MTFFQKDSNHILNNVSCLMREVKEIKGFHWENKGNGWYGAFEWKIIIFR